ncbi:MAG TPA: outer membrane protein assembly factor BamD [Vicinamibacterales bacterium]|nr:outer membrane protein assembly factor BamD [Vicinamibacterales bacterium]
MTSFADIVRTTRWTAAIAALAAVVTLQAQGQEDSARRRLESGRAFLQSQNYGEALKDFQVVLQTYPTSSVADDALLEIATYYLDVAKDVRNADVNADALLKQYADSDSAPMALVLKGRIAMAAGLGQEQVNAAMASFDRVPRLYEGTAAVPAALYYSGELARLTGRRDDAIDRFNRLTTQYPRSAWTPRALLGSASALVAAAQPLRALDQLQRVRLQFPSSREAATALEWNTILYRLYVRTPAQPAYGFSAGIGGPAGRFRDVGDIAVDRQNHLLVAAKTGVTVLDAKGAVVRSIAVQEPRAVLFDVAGRTLTIHDEGGLQEEGKPGVVLGTTTSDGKLKPLKLAAGVTTSQGDVLVADRDLKVVLRFTADGKPKGEFARQVAARRLAIGELDEVAALDTDSRTITLLSRDGKIVTKIPDRGTGYQFRQPVDVKFDRLGHLYVLDRSAVFVFGQQGSRLLTTFSVPERTPGAFGTPEMLALDSAARMYVFDARTDTVQVYQ